MSEQLIIYAANGEIEGIIEGGYKKDDYAQSSFIEVPEGVSVSPRTHVVAADRLVAKIPIDYALTGATVSNIPPVTAVRYEGQTLEIVNDGEFTLSADYPGTYVLTLVNPLYLDTQVSVTV